MLDFDLFIDLYVMIQAQPFLRWQVVIDFHMAHHILTSLYYLLLNFHLSNYEKQL